MSNSNNSRFTDPIEFGPYKMPSDDQKLFDAGQKAGLAGEPEIASKPYMWRAGWTSGSLKRSANKK